MALTFRGGENQLEGASNAIRRGAAADVEEVGGFAAMQLAHVHGGHGQTGAIDHATDIAIQRHIVQTDLMGDVLTLIFLGGIAHFGGVFVPIQSIVVQTNLGVQRHHLTISSHDQRVDLDHAAIFLDEQVVNAIHHLDQLVDFLLAHAHLEAQVAGLVGLEAGGRIDGESQNLFWTLGGDFFDIHAALGRTDQNDALFAAVHQTAQIILFSDVHTVLDQQLVNLDAFGAGLMGVQGGAQQRPATSSTS
jgi:hypothetical protein